MPNKIDISGLEDGDYTLVVTAYDLTEPPEVQDSEQFTKTGQTIILLGGKGVIPTQELWMEGD